jgi:hypothetical protein
MEVTTTPQLEKSGSHPALDAAEKISGGEEKKEDAAAPEVTPPPGAKLREHIQYISLCYSLFLAGARQTSYFYVPS